MSRAAAGFCGDVAEGDFRERLLPGLKQVGQGFDARVRHLDHAEVGLASRGAVPGLGRESGQCVEYRGLSCSWEADESNLHRKTLSSFGRIRCLR